MTIGKGRRCSAATAYLRPALRRPNLTVKVRALTSRILIDNGRATGVEYLHAGAAHTARARREVILSGGVINSPQLLMLSGIGDPDELQRHGIPGQGRRCRRRAQSAGPRLGDPDVPAAEPGPFFAMMRYDRIARELAQGVLLRQGLRRRRARRHRRVPQEHAQT